MFHQPRHKPTPLKFPGLPLTPPETIQSQGSRRMPKTAADDLQPPANMTESLRAYPAPMADFAARNSARRTSSIGYFSSGLQDAIHERPQKTNKSFIIIIPPLSFSREDREIPSLGLGPRHRLSQGLVVPLCSTMYGQLNIIAREFSFPSTTGICLYMSFNEDGVAMKPRILDEAWPIIWRDALELDSIAQISRSPISGKVEFDIDLYQARWYPSWISSLQRNFLSQNLHNTPSVSYSRTESRMTFRDDEVNGETQPDLSTAPPSNSRYMPRKLTLLDKQETSSNISASTHRSFLSPEKPHQSAQILSPIFQASEPQSARSALHSKVENWRATATVKPKLLATTGQISLEAPNIPNTLPIEDVMPTATEEEDDETHLSDYQWSISSAGPPDYEPISPSVWDGPASVHLLQRNQGSVCLTSSIQTSFGPDDSIYSPISSVARLPSPDIAGRMLEDCPPTPSTATSWGAPIEWPASPFIPSRPPSVHLGDRMDYSRPVTPSTATSWGVPSPLPSPAFRQERPRSVHMVYRDGISRPVTPDVDIDEFEYYGSSVATVLVKPWECSFPYLNQQSFADVRDASDCTALNTQPWILSWPHFRASQAPSRVIQYPYLIIYESVYPNFDLYPSIPGGLVDAIDNENHSPISVKLQTSYPTFKLYPAVYPWNLQEIYPEVSLSQEGIGAEVIAGYQGQPSTGHPLFNLYPAVYPWNLEEIYPALPVFTPKNPDLNNSSSVRLPVNYPTFDLYPAVYPWNLQVIYPVVSPSNKPASSNSPISTQLESRYPGFDLYPAVYPWNLAEIYPSLRRSSEDQVSEEQLTLSVRLPAYYPNFDLYTPVYPWNLQEIYPLVLSPAASKPSIRQTSISVKLPSSYPNFDLYPSVYPWNLDEIYPPTRPRSPIQLGSVLPILVRIPACYPHFDLYPTVYPGNLDEIYPIFSQTSQSAQPQSTKYKATGVRLTPEYPVFELYAPVYPWNLDSIYPATKIRRDTKTPFRTVSMAIPQSYPFLSLYPSVYPYLEIYPSIQPSCISSEEIDQSITSVSSCTIYPYLNLYPSVYPYFDLYPRLQPIISLSKAAEKVAPRYLPTTTNHEVADTPNKRTELPATPVTPATWDQIFRLLSEKRQSQPDPVVQSELLKKTSRLTHAELHAIVMMEDASFARRISSLPISPSTSTQMNDENYYALQFDRNLETPVSPTFHAHDIITAFGRPRLDDDGQNFFPSSPTFSEVSVYSRPASQDFRYITGFGSDEIDVSA